MRIDGRPETGYRGSGLKTAFAFTLLLVSSFAFAAESAQEADLVFARKAFNNGFYDIARDKLEDYLKNYSRGFRLYEAHNLLGRSYYNQTNYSRALYEFGLVLDAPGASEFHGEALYWSGEIHLKSGEPEKALDLFEKAISDFPSSGYMPYSVYSKGWAYYKLGSLDDAVASFRETVSRYPLEKTAPEAQFRVCECEYLLGNYDRALDEIAVFFRKFPVSDRTSMAYYLNGEALFHKAMYKDSIGAFERALAISPGADWSAFARYRMALSLYNCGDRDRSVKELKACLESSGDRILSGAAIMDLARSYEDQGNMKDARDAWETVIRKYADTPAVEEAYYRKIRLLGRKEKYADAELLSKETLRKFPGSSYAARIHYEIGLLCIAQGRTEEAVKEFASAAENSKDVNLVSSALCRIGDIYYRKKAFQRSMESYDKVLDAHPDSPDADYAQYQIGNIFLNSAKYDQAILAYRNILMNFPKTELVGDVMLRLGIAYFKVGDFENASPALEKFLKEFPRHRAADQASFYLANSMYNTRRYSEALRIFEALERGSPDERMRMMASYQTGWCHYGMARDEEALALFTRFVKSYPNSDMTADAMLWLGEYYSSKSKYDRARECFSYITKNFPSSDIAANAVYAEALAMDKGGRSVEAVDKFEEFAAKYPQDGSAKEAYRKIARIKADKKDFDGAAAYYRKALGRADTELNAQIQYEIAESLEKKGDLLAAAGEYLNVPALYAKGRFWTVRAMFNSARIFEKLKMFNEAERLYKKLAAMNIEKSDFAKRRLKWIKRRRLCGI